MRGHRLKFPKHIGIVFLSLNIDFVFANSADTDKVPLSKVVLYSRVLKLQKLVVLPK